MCDPAATGLHKHVAFDKNFHEKVETAGEMKEKRSELGQLTDWKY